jgi:hypothetical protein
MAPTPAAERRAQRLDVGFGVPPALGRVSARRQRLSFLLPDVRGWRLDRRHRHTWRARHDSSDSRVAIRSWPLGGVAEPVACELSARTFLTDLPERVRLRALHEGTRELAGLARVRVTVGVASGPGGQTAAHALAVGGEGRQCLVVAIATRAGGANAERLVAARIGLLLETVLGRLARLDAADRVSVPRR